MNNKRKRRRLLDKKFNEVSKDFGGTVPMPLFRYLRSLGSDGKTKENYKLWGYKRVLEFSKSVFNGLKDDIIIILGVNNSLTNELGKTTFLIYSKSGYQDTLIHVTHEENEELAYHSSVDFSILV